MTPSNFERLNSDGSPAELVLSEEVVRAAKAGEQDAWERIYLLFSRHLYAFLMLRLSHTDDAGEALSETYLRAIEKVDTFRGGVSSLRPWLFTIARNVAMDRLRARKRLSPQADLEDVIDLTALETEDRLVGFSERSTLAAAIRGLPADDREVLWLRFGEGMSSDEVARVVGKRAGAVRMQQMRALQVLAEAVRP